jgi:hypothetical protein
MRCVELDATVQHIKVDRLYGVAPRCVPNLQPVERIAWLNAGPEKVRVRYKIQMS